MIIKNNVMLIKGPLLIPSNHMMVPKLAWFKKKKFLLHSELRVCPSPNINALQGFLICNLLSPWFPWVAYDLKEEVAQTVMTGFFSMLFKTQASKDQSVQNFSCEIGIHSCAYEHCASGPSVKRHLMDPHLALASWPVSSSLCGVAAVCWAASWALFQALCMNHREGEQYIYFPTCCWPHPSMYLVGIL